MRYMTDEAWDEFGYSLAFAINSLASHQPTMEVVSAKAKLQEALVDLQKLGVFFSWLLTGHCFLLIVASTWIRQPSFTLDRRTLEVVKGEAEANTSSLRRHTGPF
jgi:hypothetical protein